MPEVDNKAAGVVEMLNAPNNVEVMWLTHLFIAAWKSGFSKILDQGLSFNIMVITRLNLPGKVYARVLKWQSRI